MIFQERWWQILKTIDWLMASWLKNVLLPKLNNMLRILLKCPCLVSILIGDVPEAAVYVRNQARGAEQAGMPFSKLIGHLILLKTSVRQGYLPLTMMRRSRYYSPKTCARPHQCKILTISYSSIKRCWRNESSFNRKYCLFWCCPGSLHCGSKCCFN